jgi:hypothetical protein
VISAEPFPLPSPGNGRFFKDETFDPIKNRRSEKCRKELISPVRFAGKELMDSGLACRARMVVW